jgi:hypothetical protein
VHVYTPKSMISNSVFTTIWRCLFYCQKMAFVGEFQHTPLWEFFLFSMFHTSSWYAIL